MGGAPGGGRTARSMLDGYRVGRQRTYSARSVQRYPPCPGYGRIAYSAPTLNRGRKQAMVRIAKQEFDPAISLAAIRPHPENVNQGDIGAISESMETHGFYGGIIVQRSTGFILVGNHRYLTAVQDGELESLPGFWLDCDDDQAQRILLVDNRSNRLGTDDEPALAALLQGIIGRTGNLAGTGFAMEDLDDLLQQLTPPDLGELVGAGAPGGDDLWPELKFRVSPETRERFYAQTEAASDLSDAGRFTWLLEEERT